MASSGAVTVVDVDKNVDQPYDQASSEDEVDPKAFSFYPSDSASRKNFFPQAIRPHFDRNVLGKGKGYLDAPTVPGASEAYTLPPGIDTCPVDGCTAFYSGRKFRPPWRLNEHMKTRHGWPRRQTLPSTDHDEDPPSRSTRQSEPSSTRSLRRSFVNRDSIVSNDRLISGSVKRKFRAVESTPKDREQSAVVSEPSGSNIRPRSQRIRRQTSRGREMANSLDQLASATSNRISARSVKKTRDRSDSPEVAPPALNEQDDATSESTPLITDASDAATSPVNGSATALNTDGAMDIDMDIDMDSPETPMKYVKSTLEQSRDYELIAGIKSFVAELRAGATQNPELAIAAEEYENLVRKDFVRVNCVFSEREADLLADCYARVAERHNARAMVYTMQPVSMPPQHAYGYGAPPAHLAVPPHPYHGDPSTPPPPPPPVVPYHMLPQHQPPPHHLLPPPPQSAAPQLQNQRPPSPRSFTFVDDAPKVEAPRVATKAAPAETNGFTPVNAPPRLPSQPAPGQQSATKPPITLKLKLGPPKDK